MSLDMLQFLKDDFIRKYKGKLIWSTIDSPLRTIFHEYSTLLEHIGDIASLQGANKDLLYFLNCAVDDCLVESSSNQGLQKMVKLNLRGLKQKNTPDKEKLQGNLVELKYIIARHRGSIVSAPHKPASIPLLNHPVHGFQGQFDEIVKRISFGGSQAEKSQPAVGIVGLGGSGKTTLASMVFNSREVREKYQIMIWASLTATLNKKESTRASVFMDILNGVHNHDSLKTILREVKYHHGGPQMAGHVLDKYIEHFKEVLGRNRYMIVLDDVWETEHWFAENDVPVPSKPKSIFSREWIAQTGGTVVVTTRLEEMAENVVGKEKLYMIKPLSHEACFEIFVDEATRAGHIAREDELLKKMRKDIDEKCYGLPLAACTVAEIIVAKRQKEDAAKAEALAEVVEAKEDVAAKGVGPPADPTLSADGELKKLEEEHNEPMAEGDEGAAAAAKLASEGASRADQKPSEEAKKAEDVSKSEHAAE